MSADIQTNTVTRWVYDGENDVVELSDRRPLPRDIVIRVHAHWDLYATAWGDRIKVRLDRWDSPDVEQVALNAGRMAYAVKLREESEGENHDDAYQD